LDFPEKPEKKESPLDMQAVVQSEVQATQNPDEEAIEEAID
jgi:hypothetical protein